MPRTANVPEGDGTITGSPAAAAFGPEAPLPAGEAEASASPWTRPAS